MVNKRCQQQCADRPKLQAFSIITRNASIFNLNEVAECCEVTWRQRFVVNRQSASCPGHTSREQRFHVIVILHASFHAAVDRLHRSINIEMVNSDYEVKRSISGEIGFRHSSLKIGAFWQFVSNQTFEYHRHNFMAQSDIQGYKLFETLLVQYFGKYSKC